MKSALRFVLAAIGVVAVASVAAQSLRQGRANAIMFEAAGEMDAWHSAAFSASPENRRRLRTALEEAVALDARDPTTYELLALLESMSSEREGFERAALANLRKALELRPTSAYTWANLARALYEAGATDVQFEIALRRAADLGPAEPQIQRTVVDYGLALGDQLAPATHAAVERMLAAGIERNPLEIRQIADRRGRLASVCGRLAGASRGIDAKGSQLCPSTEATP